MPKGRSTGGLWGGLALVIVGIIGVKFGIDFPHANTFVDPELIAGALLILGCACIGIGLISMLIWWLHPGPVRS